MSRNVLFAAILWSALSAVAFAPLAQGQSSTATSAMDQIAPIYDATKETKIQGTIRQIEAVKTGVAGTHLMITTQNGAVDAHLGAGPAVDTKRLGLSVGQSVEVTGMMAVIGGSSVFLARTLVVGGHTITLRSEHGIPVRAVMPQKSAAAANAPKGGL
jgi:hypothetical protein